MVVKGGPAFLRRKAASMRELRRYETRPVQLWGRMKELWRKHSRH
jgi:hypothetical protein